MLRGSDRLQGLSLAERKRANRDPQRRRRYPVRQALRRRAPVRVHRRVHAHGVLALCVLVLDADLDDAEERAPAVVAHVPADEPVQTPPRTGNVCDSVGEVVHGAELDGERPVDVVIVPAVRLAHPGELAEGSVLVRLPKARHGPNDDDVGKDRSRERCALCMLKVVVSDF